MPERAVGVMGGTFDPIHYGHLVAASEVADRFELDEVVFIPTGQPWQKRTAASGEDRYLMAVLATAADPRFTVSRMEIDRDGPTYTIDTLEQLGVSRPFLIAGADAVSGLTTWRRYEDVLRLARVIAVTRPDHAIGLDHLPSGSVTSIEIPALAISSTQIRERVAAGRPTAYLVPQPVAAYIGKRGLYR